MDNLVIACSNLFPAHVFENLTFDEAIEFGYEEMDMADQLLSAGFRIEYRPELLDYHRNPGMTAQERRLRDAPITRTRFYTSIKHYLRHGRRTMVPLYVVVASVHEAAHRVDRATVRLRWERSPTCRGLSFALAAPTARAPVSS